MISILFNRVVRSIIFFSLCLFVINTNATTDPQISKPIRGSQGEFVVNAESYVKDIKYFSLNASNKNAIQNNSIVNLVGLRIDELTNYFIPSNFSATVNVEIKTYDKNEVIISTITKSFTVNYDKAEGAKYKSFDYAIYSNAFAVKVKILSINVGSASWPVANVLKIENQLTATRDYPFNCTMSLADLSTSFSTANTELIASWSSPSLDNNSGVTEYDLEWAWIDEGSIDKYKSGSNFVEELLFANNATRVTISSTQYSIPMLYDDEGRVFVRVRPVQVLTNGLRIEGKWTWINNNSAQPAEYASPVYYSYGGHEGDLNWQASTSFAEEGKRKSVIQYFDGSLRGRQTVTKDNTTNTIIIAESFYDYQGRPVVQLLPSPTLKTAIAYVKNFNRAIGYEEYPKSAYDKLDISETICSSPAAPFNTDFGTANYYSAKNPMLSSATVENATKYIPDATATDPAVGYPFTETRLAPDGRVISQGGVGINHQIGSNHETKYYYETPSQEELDALFGTDAGIASHYFKNIVKDANGQYSVSYVDMHGRTIATALAGENPKNTDGSDKLKSLDSKSSQAVTKQLIDKETNVIVGNSIISSKPIVVLKDNTTYSFDYNLSAKQLKLLSCTGQSICYDCLYQVKFTITSDCDNDYIYLDSSLNFTLGQYLNSCTTSGNANQGFNKHFEIILNQGSYTITKTLSLSKEAQAAYKEVFVKNDTCRKFIEIYNNQLQFLQATSNCAITCESCKEALGNDPNSFIAKYKAEMNIPTSTVLSAELTTQLTNAYHEAYSNCDRLCNKNNDSLDVLRNIRNLMLMDVSPPTGQYAKLGTSNISENYNIFKDNDLSNALEQFIVRPFNFSSTYKADYLRPRQLGVDDQTSISTGKYFDEFGQQTIIPFDASPTEFANMFKNAWAEQLLVHHPEFRKLQICEGELKPSLLFETTLEKDSTWAQAAAHGFITDILSQDPFFSGTRAPLKSVMEYGRWLNQNEPPSGTNLNFEPQVHGVYQYMNLHNSPDCPGGSLFTGIYPTMWQIALGTVFCREKREYNTDKCDVNDYTDITTKAGCTMNPNYAAPQNNFNEGCVTDRDWAWKTFKTLYLAERRKLISAYLNYVTKDKVFPTSYPNKTPEPYTERFINYANPSSTLANLGIEGKGSISDIINNAINDLNAGSTDAEALATQQYDSVCVGYANTWIAQLRACSQLNTLFNNATTWKKDSTWIVSRLVAVCVNGSDNQHYLGSSSVKPGNVATIDGVSYKNFPEVIQEFLQNKNITNPTETCYDWLITTPKPYDKQKAVITSYTIAKPTDCECQRISDLGVEWKNAHFAGTFSEYLYAYHGTYITTEQLDILLALCNGTYSCNLLDKPIAIPPVLQCPSGNPAPKTCIDCRDYAQLKEDFYNSSNGVNAPFISPTNETQINQNISFANFANNATGFSKTWMEYVAFQKTCDAVVTEISCTSLNNSLTAFYATPQYLANTTGTACTQAFVNYFNSVYNVVYTFDYWMNLFAKCGSTPNVCKEQITCTKFENLINDFYVQNGVQVYKNSNCQSLFVSYINTRLNSNYTYTQLEEIYSYTCKKDCGLEICSFPNQFLLNKVVKDFKDAFPQPWMLANCQTTFADYFNTYFGFPFGTQYPAYPFALIKRVYFDRYIKSACVTDISNLCTPPYKCDDLDLILRKFLEEYKQEEGVACQDAFTSYFNQTLGTGYTYVQIANLYLIVCGTPLKVCEVATDCKSIIAFASTNIIRAENEDICHATFLQQFNTYFATNFDSWDQLVELYKNCDYDLNIVCKNCGVLTVNCDELKVFEDKFLAEYPDPTTQLGGECQDVFAARFNEHFNTKLTYAEIETYYLKQCGIELNICDLKSDIILEFVTKFNNKYSNLKLPTAAKEDLFAFEYNMAFLKGATEQPKIIAKDTEDGQILVVEENPTQDARSFKLVATYPEILETIKSAGLENFTLETSTTISEYDPQVLLSLKQVFYIIHPYGLPDDCKGEFQSWYNIVMKSSYGFEEQMALYNTVCGNNAGYICEPAPEEKKEVAIYVDINQGLAPELPPMLCGLNDAGSPPVFVDDSPCKDLPKIALHYAQEKYELYVDSVRNVFDLAYYNKCMAAKDLESFTVSYTTSEYHYTLYYYDQAGNLVKTVPPAGVQKLTNTQLATVKTYRANVLNGGNESSNSLTPSHTLATEYRYNTLKQVIAQKSPDGGLSQFYYDRLGRLVVSQNAKQAANNNYSYTLYDALGRIKEVGQLHSTTPITQAIAQKDGTASVVGSLANWLNGKTAEQITKTYYDIKYYNADPSITLCPTYLCQDNLRNRVSYTAVFATGTVGVEAGAGLHNTATFYTYDIHGNVNELLQDYNAGTMKTTDNRFKKIAYTYDLISGKVNTVSYQPNQKDAFYHRYSYDAENKITQVETSFDASYSLLGGVTGGVWERDAQYKYYKHGPLARTILGELEVQGLDYVYNLNGWLKGVNGTAVNSTFDVGKDGSSTSLIAKDVFGFSLNYYNGDYKPIGGTTANAFASILPSVGGVGGGSGGGSLYNGNIAAMAVNIPKLGDAMVYNHQYDQLNRLVAMDAYTGLSNTNNTFTPVSTTAYKEGITYDANGNILTYARNGNAARLSMDNMTYTYKAGTNQLDKVVDAAQDAAASEYDKYKDIKQGQTTGNYTYDEIGNLISDRSEGITNITWTVYGKINSISKTDGTTINYTYDASGNRISKIISPPSGGVGGGETYYVRDASGNVMSVYTKNAAVNSGHITQFDISLYGIGRVGSLIVKKDLLINESLFVTRGLKNYELSNHLQNVLVVVSDKKIAFDINSDGIIDNYNAEVAFAKDYYINGMQMPGRIYNIAPSEYRYGFNGKENDNDINEGSVNFDARILDNRIGRWYSTDLHEKSYISPYSFARNSAINLIDHDGNDEIHFHYLTIYVTQAKFNSAEGKLQQVQVPVTYTWTRIIQDNNKNTYFVHRDIAKRDGTVSPTTPTQFFPDPAVLAPATGVTHSYAFGLFRYKDDDYTALLKILADFPEFVGYCSTPVITDPNRAKTTEDKNRDFLSQACLDKRMKAIADKEEEAVNSLLVNVFLILLAPEERLVTALEIFGETGAIGTRVMAEKYALQTSYKGYVNANKLIANNKTFDLFSIEKRAIVDVTTMDGKITSVSSISNKLKNLSNLKNEFFTSRTLQIYVKEGKYTAEEINGLKQYIESYMETRGIKNVNYSVDVVK